MINEIIQYRRQGMSFRKIADKLNSTVGKVHYQWIKNGMDESNIEEVQTTQEEVSIQSKTNNQPQNESDYYLVTQLVSNQKLVSNWKISSWKKDLAASYFDSINVEVIIFRLYDVTDIYFNGSNAHSIYEFQLPKDAFNWTLKGIKQGRSYLTEIGYKVNENQFFPILRSNAVHNLPDAIEQMGSLTYQHDAFYNERILQPKWTDKVSTYSYYENINEEHDNNG
jgi:uncharacterized protein